MTDYYTPFCRDGLYHVYNRGNGAEKLFYKDRNYDYFLHQYAKYSEGILDTFAYCLLPNHFHLLVRIKEPDFISENFRKLFISYAMSINKQEGRKGNLLQRWVKRKHILNERYFFAAVYYIHANAVHHGIVKSLADYKHSSYKIFLSEKDTRIKREEVFEWFGGKKNFIDYHAASKCSEYDDNYIIEN